MLDVLQLDKTYLDQPSDVSVIKSDGTLLLVRHQNFQSNGIKKLEYANHISQRVHIKLEQVVGAYPPSI